MASTLLLQIRQIDFGVDHETNIREKFLAAVPFAVSLFATTVSAEPLAQCTFYEGHSSPSPISFDGRDAIVNNERLDCGPTRKLWNPAGFS